MLFGCVAVAVLPTSNARSQSQDQSSGSAQLSPTTKPDSPAQAVAPVTVVGSRPLYQRYIDRKSYSLSSDPTVNTESLGDALRKLPSVDVDPTGNVSIRGDRDVTVLVDGQPSALFQGPGRAISVRGLPANQFERVEVMTNPSAAFSAAGSGGVINLITKKHHNSSPTAQVSANGDTLGDARVSLLGSAGLSDKLLVSGSLNFESDRLKSETSTEESLPNPPSPTAATVDEETASVRSDTAWLAQGNAIYKLDTHSQLTSGLAYFNGSFATNGQTDYASSATSGSLANDYLDAQRSSTQWSGVFGTTSYVNQLPSKGQQVSLNLTYSANWFSTSNAQNFTFTSPSPQSLFQEQIDGRSQYQASLEAEYKTLVFGPDKLDTGYQLDFEQDRYTNGGLSGTAASDATLVPAFADALDFRRFVNSAFITLEGNIGRLDVMPGVRVEATSDALGEFGVGAAGETLGYVNVFPSLHAQYKADRYSTFSASFDERVQRPSGQQLDSFRVELTPLLFSQGNSGVRPEITDSVELEYEYNADADYLSIQGYYKYTHGTISSVTENLGGGVLLTTFENVGRWEQGGSEVVYNKSLGKALSLSLDGAAQWEEFSGTPIDGGVARSGTYLTLKANVDWQPTARDFLQLSGNAASREVTAQGYNLPYSYLNLGYRHKFNSRLAMELRVADILESSRSGTVIAIPGLQTRSVTIPNDRALTIGLTYALGGSGKSVRHDFEFTRGAAPP